MAEQKVEKLKNGEKAPHFSVVDINGETVQVGNDNGKKILLSFFLEIFSSFSSCRTS